MSKYCDTIANIVDLGQTAPQEQFDQDLHCFLRYLCPNIRIIAVNLESAVIVYYAAC